MQSSSTAVALLLALSQFVVAETIVQPSVTAMNEPDIGVLPNTPGFLLSILSVAESLDPAEFSEGSTTWFAVTPSATTGFATIAYADTDLGKERMWFAAELDQRFTPSTRADTSYLGSNFFLEGVADPNEKGSIDVPLGSDFWLAVNTSTVLDSSLDYFGWVRLNIDQNLQVTALDSAYSLDGEGIIIGRLAVPEPGSGLMAFMAAAMIGRLRRKHR